MPDSPENKRAAGIFKRAAAQLFTAVQRLIIRALDLLMP